MELQHLFDYAVGIILAMVSFFVTKLNNDVTRAQAEAFKAQKETAELKNHIAENYAHNGRIDDIRNELSNANKRLDAIYELLTRRHVNDK